MVPIPKMMKSVVHSIKYPILSAAGYQSRMEHPDKLLVYVNRKISQTLQQSFFKLKRIANT